MSIEKVTGAVINTAAQTAAKNQKIGELVNALNAVKEQKTADVFVKSARGTAASLGDTFVKKILPSSFKDIQLFDPSKLGNLKHSPLPSIQKLLQKI